MVKRSLTHRVLLRVRVINNKQIRTTARDRSTNTSRKVLAALFSAPLTSALVVFFQIGVRKNLFVRRIVNHIPHLATKPNSKLGVVRSLNNLELRVPAQEPRRHQKRSKLRLRMTWRHVDNQPLQLPLSHLLQLFSNNPVMSALNEVLIHMVSKRHEVVSRRFPKRQLRVSLRKRKNLPQYVVR